MSVLSRMAGLLCAFSLLATLAVPDVALAQAAPAAPATSTISGSLVDQAGGVPVSNATVTLFQNGRQIVATKSDANGGFQFQNQPAGVYTVEVRAEGYGGVRSSDLVASPGSTTQFRAVLQRASTSSGQLTEIGRVSAAQGRNQLSTATTISQTLPSALVINQGYNRIGDALGVLPGVNLSGLSSSIGDDLSVNIRGFGTSETQTLIDGHPVGPFGPGSGGFSFQDSPAFAIGQTVVTVGSGALGLYGTDSIGGTVDQQTLEPTRDPHFFIQQGFGNFGKSYTDLQATGTFGKVGFALVHAVEGTYGPWAPAQRVQPGGLGFDFSDPNLAANTYSTSGNYLLRNDLIKLRYSFDEKTQLTASFLSATSWDDKSGNGDNCFNTVGYQTFQGNQIIASGPSTYPSAANPGDPGSITCTGSIAVNLNSGPACVDSHTYATLSNGLVPGGPGPFQAHRLLDYHGRLTHLFGNNFVTVDFFKNRFTTDYNRNLAGSLDPTGSFHTGGFNSNFYDTTGFLVSDDIATENNDLGFGYYLQHQRIYGDQYVFDGTSGTIQPLTEYGSGESNFFLRDILNAQKRTSFYLNAWLKRSTVTQKTTFDPRLSIVFRATGADVIRLTGGRSDGEPAPNLLFGPPNLNTTPQNISNPPRPPLLTEVGSVANPTLQPETSTDLELAYGHRFAADSIIQLDFYESFEKNRIFSGVLPVSSIGPNPIPPFLLQEYYAQINRAYPDIPISSLTLADLGVTTNFNASSARFQGVEITGRQRFSRTFYADYSYDIQSGVLLAVPDSILMSQPFVINGAQLQNLPLHKASIGLDLSNNRGFEVRIDNYYIGNNNPYNRDGFYYANGNISQNIGAHTTLNFGVQNIFNNASSSVQASGIAPFTAQNQFSTYDPGRQEGLLTTGLLPTQYTASLTLRI